MIYLERFRYPDADQEFDFFMQIKRKCYDSFYPFQIVSKCQLCQIDFDPITIFYGGNGSGKSTALNVIAKKLGVLRDSVYNQSNFYQDYLNLCEAQTCNEMSEDSRIITSDDVFDYILNIRNLNQGIDQKREDLFEEYLEDKYSSFQMKSLSDYDKLRKSNLSKRKTQSQYIRNRLMDNVREHSNGENAFQYFTEKITEKGLFILDEPENSLSPERQLELVNFLEDSVRFFGCQIIISTHSPFLLAMRGAKIYDLDQNPACTKKWTQLSNVRTYYDFFMKRKEELEDV